MAREVFISWRHSNSQDGGLPIHGALGEVVEAAHGRYVPRLNRGGGIALVEIIQEWSLHD